MKKMLKLLIVIFIIYFAFQTLFLFLGHGHDITYTISTVNGDITIHEVLKNESYNDGYYVEVATSDFTIPFKTYNKYKRRRTIVKNVDIVEGSTYKCIYVTLYNRDNYVKCLKGDIIYSYQDIKGLDKTLDKAINNFHYDISPYINNLKGSSKESITYYLDNFVLSKNFLLSDYKGVYLFGKNVTNNARFIKMFDSDKYIKNIEYSTSKYYIVADYDSSYEFKRFLVVNMANGSTDKIVNDKEISFNSFIQGEYNNKVYLVDIENKKQYAIDLKHKTISLIGSVNAGAQVLDSVGFVTKNINEVIDNRMLFYKENIDSINGTHYSRIDHIYTDNYVYVKNGNYYDAYVIYDNDSTYKKTYVFSCTDINRIKYSDEYVYYINGDELRIYGANIGNKTLVKYSELEYNKDMQFYVY